MTNKADVEAYKQRMAGAYGYQITDGYAVTVLEVEVGYGNGFDAGRELGRFEGRIEMLKEVGYALMPGHVARVDMMEAQLSKLLAGGA